MLTRVHLDNFRCFVNFDYRPKRKQLLLGANGSGKSSLLDGIRDLKRFIKGDENPFTQSTRTRWLDLPLQVLEIEALLERQKYEYRVEIGFAPETKQLSVSQERLRVSGATVFELAKGEIHFFPNNSDQATTVPLETTKSALHLSQLSNSHVRRFVEWMESVHCFRIDVNPTAMDESADREEREPDYELANLAGWYRHLVQAHPDENVRFLTSMKDVLTGFQGLRFSADEDGTRRLRADFADPRKAGFAGLGVRVNYAISELSEGQRCLLALYMILHFLIAQGHTVFIDEPDNFIALREIQPWLLVAEEAVDDHDGQLILISHHPEILNQWASRHGLLFFREDNGHVRTEKFKPDPNGNLQPSELIARGWEDE
ncbi:MAG TPA: AAA family ATPase [Terriglobia bacterium]|nr:AAA family ATPase [Terriglobia bacterium]